MLQGISHLLSQVSSVLRLCCSWVESVRGPDDRIETGVISEEVHSGVDSIIQVTDISEKEEWP